MKTTKLFLASCLTFVLFVSCKEWEVPALLVGKWESKQIVKVRTKENGNVSGHLGDAVLENCKVSKNRGNIGRTLNLATDYVIKGNLKGAIFPSDPHLTKEISAPFDVKNNKMEGSFFQMFGLDLYPVTGMVACKKE